MPSRYIAKGFQYESEINKFIKDFDRHEKKNVRAAATMIKRYIRQKATAMKKTGNLKEGVYAYHTKTGASFVGLQRPAYHAYLLEFGHKDRKGDDVKPHPVVYSTFKEHTDDVRRILERPFS